MRKFLTIFAIAAIVIAKIPAEPSDCIGSCSSSHIPYLPHKICSKFCMCTQGSPVEVFCPSGLHFSPEQYVCVNPSDTHCQGSTQSIKNKNSGCIGRCPPPSENYNPFVLLAHEECEFYCQCIKGTAVVIKCPDGFHFNFEIGTCLEPELANCTSSH